MCRRKKADEPKKTAAVPVSPVPAAGPVSEEEGMEKLSVGELSALCSNLARGCEKQYKDQEASLFRELAEYFAAVTPAEPGGGSGPAGIHDSGEIWSRGIRQ